MTTKNQNTIKLGGLSVFLFLIAPFLLVLFPFSLFLSVPAAGVFYLIELTIKALVMSFIFAHQVRRFTPHFHGAVLFLPSVILLSNMVIGLGKVIGTDFYREHVCSYSGAGSNWSVMIFGGLLVLSAIAFVFVNVGISVAIKRWTFFVGFLATAILGSVLSWFVLYPVVTSASFQEKLFIDILNYDVDFRGSKVGQCT